MADRYWLVKSEPVTFSIDDLEKSKDKTTCWDGVRNYQARNFLRNEMKNGDLVLFYHSNTEIPAAVGVCRVVKEGYPDSTAFDKKSAHYDPKSKKENPAWFMVDIKLEKKFTHPVPLNDIKLNMKLKGMKLVQPGNRLSVMPVDKAEFEEILLMSAK
jgi:predicted RNA-binding protein with PUA-like domain